MFLIPGRDQFLQLTSHKLFSPPPPLPTFLLLNIVLLCKLGKSCLTLPHAKTAYFMNI